MHLSLFSRVIIIVSTSDIFLIEIFSGAAYGEHLIAFVLDIYIDIDQLAVILFRDLFLSSKQIKKFRRNTVLV